MLLTIPRDILETPTPPTCYLCTQSGKRIGELPAYDTSLNAKWNSWSEFSLTIDRRYVDIITGETKVNPLFDKAEGLRQVEAARMGRFIIQDPDATYSDNETKTLSCLSLEYACGAKYLENFYVNNGADDSIEVTYYAQQHGGDMNIDHAYKPASGQFDEFKRYYIREYKDSDSYEHVPIAIADEEEYNRHFSGGDKNDEILYVTDYERVRFYDEHNQELSLLHIIFSYIPEWQLGNVDYRLRNKERKFEESRISIYDFLMNNVADTFNCVVEWDTLNRTVNFYEEADDGINEDGTVQSIFESDVYISRENLASEIHLQYSTDDIKTKLKVSGSDGLDIREVNCGKNYIMNLDYYHNSDWMERDLYEAYRKYMLALNGNPSSIIEKERKGYATLFNEAAQQRVSAYNKLSDLENAVPAEGNVVLIGDEFKKLYCTYSPTNTAYYRGTISGTINISSEDLYLDSELTKKIPEPSNKDMYVVQNYLLTYDKDNNWFSVEENWDTDRFALIKKLNQYHIDEDTNATKTDNILLRLKNSASDVATIRIYDKRVEATSYDERLQYYTKDSNGKFSSTHIVIKNQPDFDAQKAEFAKNGTTIWTNDYYIQSMITYASNGTNGEKKHYSLLDWIQGRLTTSEMMNDLSGYKITNIGTMGAYFVLAKDETISENLQDYGIRMLEEKHDTYTTIFQTQTEAMFSQESAQCIVQDEEPEGDYTIGTRWLDTDSNPVVLKKYNGTQWEVISGSVSLTEQENYENYQRYIDNFNKLKAVQKVIAEKKVLAEYRRNGYRVNNFVINTADLEASMKEAAQTYFGDSVSIIRKGFDPSFPVYIFTTSKYKDEEFAVYLNNSIPYVAYALSVAVGQLKMDYYSQQSELRQFFNDDQWTRLSPLIREDEFTDNNFLLTEYESEQERLNVYKELAEAAAKELKTLSQPSIKFNMNIGNMLALPEFAPIINQFSLGKFIRIDIGHGLVKKARLLEVSLQFDDLSSFNTTFGNLVATKSPIELHAELMSQAMTAGKVVAQASGSWKMATDTVNKLEQDIANGLQDATLEIGRAHGQSIKLGKYGLRGRKLIEGTTDQYEPEQVALINNKLVFTSDNWQTSKSVFGKYKVGDEERWGVLAEHITAETLEGKFIHGGSIEIGEGDTKFVVNRDGSVEIKSGSTDYVDAIKEINDAYKYSVALEYSGSTIFNAPGQSCTITCKVFKLGTEITNLPSDTKFEWIRVSNADDTEWNRTHTYIGVNTITITNADVEKNAQFYCRCTLDDTKLL